MMDSNLKVMMETSTNEVNVVGANKNKEHSFDPEIPALEDISTFNFSSDQEDVDEEADINIMDTTIQMDVKSAFLYKKIKEEVYVYQPPGFEDPGFLDKVYKVEKALYGLHQAPRAWYETLSTYLLDNGFHRGKIDKTLFIRRHKDDILLVQVYVDDIILGSTKKELFYTSCIEQFWATVKAKTVNEEGQLQALVDEKKTSVPISVADEVVSKEIDDSLERAVTTATSLDAEQDRGGGPRYQEAMGDVVAQTWSERVSKISNDPLLEGVNTPQRGEDSLKLTELMELCTKLQQRVLDLENTNTVQALDIDSLKRRVKKFERRKRSRTHRLKRLYKGRIADIDANKDITLVSTHDEQMLDADQDLGDYQLAERMQAEEQQELNDEEKAKLLMQLLEKRRKFFAAKRAEEKRNKPPKQAQKRKIMCTYLKNMEGKKLTYLKNKSFDSIQKMFDRAFKRKEISPYTVTIINMLNKKLHTDYFDKMSY
nr:putative ribonuclease H-like domain-containing protein [Tanacetum cinerariifolium]